MTRIVPKQQTDVSQLKDYEPYRVSIHAIDWIESSGEYAAEGKRLQIDWAFDPDALFTTRDYVGLRLGRQTSGQVSKLRSLLNALAHKPEATEISWFDDESLEWSYDGTTPFARLEEGLEVIVRGKIVEKPSDSGPRKRFNISAYQPAVDEAPKAAAAPPAAPMPAPVPATRGKAHSPEAAAAAAIKPAVTDVDPDEIPF